MANKGFFSGRLAAAPVLQMHSTEVCRFTLIRNEYAGKDDATDEVKERVVSVQFTAFGNRARAIAEHVSKGDQIEVEYRLENNNYQDGKGEDVYGFNFVVSEFEFGAPGSITRERLAKQS